MNSMRGIVAGFGIISALAVVLMLQFTTPQSVGPLGVLAFFILSYVICASFLYLAIGAIIDVAKRVVPSGKWRIYLDGLSGVRQYYYASFIALLPIIFLGMHSVGSVGPIEVGLLALFGLIGCFYISRRF